MNVFEVVKENVTARQAAEAYGLKVGRTGMACCPFHSDKSPSMKLDERYYCLAAEQPETLLISQRSYSVSG